MKNKLLIALNLCFLIAFLSACKTKESTKNPSNFGEDVAFLKKHQTVTLLQTKNKDGQIAVVGAYQGRVMTSTADGDQGKSHGWINYDLIRSGDLQEHINVFGGENRFWMGPEGGQYAIFFQKGTSFKAQDWYTPKSLDTEPFFLFESSSKTAIFRKNIKLKNYIGTPFDVDIKRKIQIWERDEIAQKLGIDIGKQLNVVGYQTEDRLVNQGADWDKSKGLLSIWILGMYKPSKNTVVILPYRGDLKLNTAYFGEINADRLQIGSTAVFFKGDGGYRSKIGIPPENAKPFVGSYSPDQNLLTIVQYSFNVADKDYVNSLWKLQDHPYQGDVVNSYNDGPMEDGTILGPFFELESSSPAKALKSGDRLVHQHDTFHFEGSKEQLSKIAKTVLEVDLNNLPHFK